MIIKSSMAANDVLAWQSWKRVRDPLLGPFFNFIFTFPGVTYHQYVSYHYPDQYNRVEYVENYDGRLLLLCCVLFMTEMLRRLLLVKNRFWIWWQTETRSCLLRVLPTFRVGYDITWRGEPIGSNMFICFKQNTKACCEEKCVSPGWKRVETAAKLRFCNSDGSPYSSTTCF